MNRMPNRGLTSLLATAVLVLALVMLTSVSLSAQMLKKPLSIDLPAGGSTINAVLVCHPTSGTLPLEIQIIATTYNQTGHPRECFGRVDLETAGGLYMASISKGEFSLPAGIGEYYSTSWIKPLPARILNVGVNRYTLIVTDISPLPFNQPPYPPSGSVNTGNCTVDGMIP